MFAGCGGVQAPFPDPPPPRMDEAQNGPQAQSSFKLQLFLCSRGYAMDNLDEAQCIHPS